MYIKIWKYQQQQQTPKDKMQIKISFANTAKNKETFKIWTSKPRTSA